MMMVAFKVAVFAAIAYVMSHGAIRLGAGMLDKGEQFRIAVADSRYLLKSHKVLLAIGAVAFVSKAIAIGALAVAAVMWVAAL